MENKSGFSTLVQNAGSCHDKSRIIQNFCLIAHCYHGLLIRGKPLSLLLDNLVRCYLTLIQQNFVNLSPHDLNSAIKDYASNVVVCDLLLTVSIRLFLLQLL